MADKTTGHPLLDGLKTYLRLHTDLDSESASGDFQWTPQQALLREHFPLFQWLAAGAPDSRRLFGIRRLVDRTPFRLSNLRAKGFRTESRRSPTRPPVTRAVEHYLIAELTGPQTAVVHLCMYAPPGHWYVLDEHRIAPGPPAEGPPVK